MLDVSYVESDALQAEPVVEVLEATATLTEAQEEAINAAYKRGFYDFSRRISLEELAAELEISYQALSGRLQRANKELAGEQVGDPDQDELVH